MIAEIGCGAGNSVFPLLSENQNPELVLQAFDYSNHAVKLVQSNPLYASPPCGSIGASIWDVTSMSGLPVDVLPGSVDIAVLIFVMSALHPDEWERTINNIHTMLKPGGIVVMRDYGRYDLTQLRFKTNRMLDENFYVRGDKTRVYFFELDELALMFTGSKASASQVTSTLSTSVTEDHEGGSIPELSSPLEPGTDPILVDSASVANSVESFSSNSLSPSSRPEDQVIKPSTVPSTVPWIHPNLFPPVPDCRPHPLFTLEQLGVDRRLLVNRKRQLKMYRVWVQGKFRKQGP